MCSRYLKYFFMQVYMVAIGAWKSLQEQIWDRHRTPTNLPLGRGTNVVITGGNRGIGFEAVKGFLSLGYNVIIGCRNPSSCREDLEKAIKSDERLREGTFECLDLDLTSLDSVRSFATNILARTASVDVLVNNAGIMFGPRKETKDGFESQFGVNYLGHFFLTHLLLPAMRRYDKGRKSARIVNVSSAAHYVGSWMDWDDVQSKNLYVPELAYGISKVAQVLSTRLLNSKLSDLDWGITVNCVHPGIVNTGLYANYACRCILQGLFGFLMKSPSQGADTILHASVSPSLEGMGGLYLENSRAAEPSSFSIRLDHQSKMWSTSLEMLGIKDFFSTDR